MTNLPPRPYPTDDVSLSGPTEGPHEPKVVGEPTGNLNPNMPFTEAELRYPNAPDYVNQPGFPEPDEADYASDSGDESIPNAPGCERNNPEPFRDCCPDAPICSH